MIGSCKECSDPVYLDRVHKAGLTHAHCPECGFGITLDGTVLSSHSLPSSDEIHAAFLRKNIELSDLRNEVVRRGVALRICDRALLRALSDLMGYEDGGRTDTQDEVKTAADQARRILEGARA